MGGESVEEPTGVAPSLSRRRLLRTAGTTAGAGAASAAGTGAAAGQDGNATGGAEDEVRQVEMTDDLAFVPEEITVTPGDTVRWVNVGEIPHTVTAYADEIPSEATYFASGGFESEEAAREAYPPEGGIGGDGTYEHTFEVPGSHGYFCIPHETAGMVGTVEVTEPGGASDGGGGGGGQAAAPGLPDAAKTLGVATVGAFASVLGLTYFLMKYGGQYEETE